jgi:hydrogenase maturation protein HypF
MLLEGLATRAAAAHALPRCPVGADGVLDLLPLLMPLVAAADQAQAAADFHAGLAVALADWAAGAAAAQGLATVACGGGCLMNDVLARRLRDELGRRGLAMLEAAEVPPNDGAISLGQCWVAQRTRS